MNILTENSFKKNPLPQNSNLLNVSTLTEFYSPSPYRSFSIKYVTEGLEQYSVNGTKYNIKSKQYLLANKHSEGHVLVDSKTAVKGICIDVSPQMLTEVVSSYLRPDIVFADPELGSFFNDPSFLENKYNAQHTHLGKVLFEVERRMFESKQTRFVTTTEFYYMLCEKIIADHAPIFKQLQNIKAVKTETKKHIMRKLLTAKGIMDDLFLGKLNVVEVAKECGISEYHFYRLFKNAFGKSPHQYLMQKRLEHAKKLLVDPSTSISDLAIFCGYPDIFSFSRSFKKYFGFPPSHVRC